MGRRADLLVVIQGNGGPMGAPATVDGPPRPENVGEETRWEACPVQDPRILLEVMQLCLEAVEVEVQGGEARCWHEAPEVPLPLVGASLSRGSGASDGALHIRWTRLPHPDGHPFRGGPLGPAAPTHQLASWIVVPHEHGCECRIGSPGT